MKYADCFDQALGLVFQALGSRSTLFNQGSVLLGDGIHLTDGLVGLQNAVTLFAGSGADVGNQHRNLLYLLHDGFNLGLCAGNQGGAALHVVDASANQGLDFLGCGGAALGQCAYFRGNDCKTAPLLACAGSFYGGIQRQNVGLKSNRVRWHR